MRGDRELGLEKEVGRKGYFWGRVEEKSKAHRGRYWVEGDIKQNPGGELIMVRGGGCIGRAQKKKKGMNEGKNKKKKKRKHLTGFSNQSVGTGAELFLKKKRNGTAGIQNHWPLGKQEQYSWKGPTWEGTETKTP